jgi:hypothetical protein
MNLLVVAEVATKPQGGYVDAEAFPKGIEKDHRDVPVDTEIEAERAFGSEAPSSDTDTIGYEVHNFR